MQPERKGTEMSDTLKTLADLLDEHDKLTEAIDRLEWAKSQRISGKLAYLSQDVLNAISQLRTARYKVARQALAIMDDHTIYVSPRRLVTHNGYLYQPEAAPIPGKLERTPLVEASTIQTGGSNA